MALKFFKLYGYGLGVVLLCLGVYVGVFMAEVKHKSADQAQIEPPKVQAQAQEKSTEQEQAQEAPKGATPTEGKEATEVKVEAKSVESKEANKETKTTETKEVQENTAKKAKPTPQEQAPKEQATEAKEGAKEPPYTIYHVDVSAVNVRTKPSTHAPVVAKILRGHEVHVLEVKEGWGRVDKGWVYLPLLKKEQ
ncbi:hypothetical protein NHP21005_00530 [Helicobacter sp. NHP21005]|uniref:SH3 domain-containing protein n=1 Tax=Helicobacter felistomachi TaxID=3040201 RepID=UPI0025745CF0|nr:SH3 domain-containing protein [Helicobacter sp. NHP21005]BEG56365.1 hypothetical protein NHP21005_00530 [Helicobacter sp. NHP21005]